MADRKKRIVSRERLKAVHDKMHEAMAQLEETNYSTAMDILRVADKLLLDLIDDAGGQVVRSKD